MMQSFDIQLPTPEHGGHDPDDMNDQREGWGSDLVHLVRSLTGTDEETAVRDAIAYLLHAAHAMDQDPARELYYAVQHFNMETSEEG